MKKIMALILTVVMLFSVASCGEKETEFDAKGYVQAIMDAKFKREYKNYAKIVGITEEEAKEQMESEFHTVLEASMKEFGSQYGITDDEMAQYIQLEADVRAKVQYTVSDAVKDDEGNYTVSVQITPILAYENWETIVHTKLTTAMQNGATKEQYMSVLLEGVQECFENAEKGESVTFTFHVTGEESEDKILYGVSGDEMLSVDLIATGQPTK